jgi:uncharacterized membrane protein
MLGSFLLSMVRGLHVMLTVHVVLDLVFVAYIGLLIRMRNLAAEREMKLTFLPAPMQAGSPARGYNARAAGAGGHAHAASGYTGAGYTGGGYTGTGYAKAAGYGG